MKKLMLAVAAVAAGAALADVTSANIVGYQNVGLAEGGGGGAKMITMPFNAIGEDGMRISSIIPQGYEENTALWKSKGIDGEFSIQLLAPDGTTAIIPGTEEEPVLMFYSWVHSCTRQGAWDTDAHWNDPYIEEVEPGADNDYLFPRGTGLYMNIPENSEDDFEAVYDTTPAGEVNTNDVKVVLAAEGGAVGAGNPFPIGVRISSLIPIGYEDNTGLWKSKGIDGEFSIQILASDGTTAIVPGTEEEPVLMFYSWVHSCTRQGAWDTDAHWNDPYIEEIVPGAENDFIIEPGVGLWINAPEKSEDDAEAEYSITFKYPGTL